MTPGDFSILLSKRLNCIADTLHKKGAEYAPGDDRLHNFKVAAAEYLNGAPEMAAWGFLAKHLVSLRDMIFSGKEYPEAQWDEKIGDAINYLILIEAIVKEQP